MKVGETAQIEVYGELCCELCMDIIHNHLDCPVCGKKCAPSKQYAYLAGNAIECKNCDAVFKKVNDEHWYDYPVVEYMGKDPESWGKENV